MKRITFTLTEAQYELLQEIRNAYWVEYGHRISAAALANRLIFSNNRDLEEAKYYLGHLGV